MTKTITYKDFGDCDAKRANEFIELFEGEQLECLINLLDGKESFGSRHEWKTRGYIPAVRNITKPIIEKSGMLFNKPPTLELWQNGTILPVSNSTLEELFHSIDWLDFFQNVDTYTRMLKTTVVLWTQYIPENVLTADGIYKFNQARGDALLPILLHRGNTVVKTDFTGRLIKELGYITSDDMDTDDLAEEDSWTYRVITPELIEDWKVIKTATKDFAIEELIDVQPNPYGYVPAVVFYDTAKPINGFWAEIPEDLPNFQKIFNLHLTDTNFAMAWQKQKTLFVNSVIVEGEAAAVMVPTAHPGHTEAGAVYDQLNYFTQRQGSTNNIGGLGKVIRLSNDEQGNPPMVEFKGPDTDLVALQDVLKEMLIGMAKDWSVNLEYGGSGKANSGFQLIVEEIDNLSLREKRAHFFTSAFKRSYEVLKTLYPELPDGQLLIKFAPPSLPVNVKEQEDIWSQKISEGRASIIDYFMEVFSLTKEEAINKAQEIKDFNTVFLEKNAPPAQGA